MQLFSTGKTSIQPLYGKEVEEGVGVVGHGSQVSEKVVVSKF
jgi:hypothetical protein